MGEALDDRLIWFLAGMLMMGILDRVVFPAIVRLEVAKHYHRH